MKIEHLALNVARANEHVAWYVAHLGLKIVRQLNDPNQTHFIVDDSGQIMLELYSNPNATVPDYAAIHPLQLHIAFSTSTIEAERDRLVQAGATVAGEMLETPAGDLLLFLRDPWDVPIQLVQRKNAMI
jgi:glyoxylase I family protein